MKKTLLLVALTFCCSVFAQMTAEKEITLIQQIQQLTRSTTWTPGMTCMSNFTHEQRVKVCGLHMGKRMLMDEATSDVTASSADLRQKGVVPDIRDQGQCGSCWAFSSTACVEIVNGGKSDLSEQQVVSCCNTCMGCDGGYISEPLDWVKAQGGIVLESVYPYTSGETQQTGDCESHSGAKHTISGYSSCSTSAAVKAALDAGHPVNIGMDVYDDFMHYKSGVYKHVSGDMLGGHAVVIVGYNNSGSYWIVRNSWTENWGENGYIRIAYSNGCNVPSEAVAVK